MSRFAPLSLDEERRKKRTTHVEGRSTPNQQPFQQSNWGRIEQLTNRIENGGASRSNGAGSGGAGGAGGAGGLGGGGGGGAIIMDGSEETAFSPPADGQQQPTEAQDAQQANATGQPGQNPLKIWSTFNMFDDEQMKHERDVQDLMQRLREEAVKDQSKVADYLKEHPELTAMLVRAIPDQSALNGWGAGNNGGPTSDGGGGFFV